MPNIPMKFEVNVKFNQQLFRKLISLTDKDQRSVQSKAVRAAWTVVMREAKKGVPKQTRALWRNLSVSVKRDRRTTQLVGRVIGRNKKDAATGRNPARYLHLVENGAAPHTISAPPGEHLRVGIDAYPAYVQHPGARANKFLRHAFNRKWREAEDVLYGKLSAEIQKVSSRPTYTL